MAQKEYLCIYESNNNYGHSSINIRNFILFKNPFSHVIVYHYFSWCFSDEFVILGNLKKSPIFSSVGMIIMMMMMMMPAGINYVSVCVGEGSILCM